MQFHVLGPVRVTNRGRQLSLGGRQQRLVLALLLSRPGESISTDQLVDRLWDGDPPATAHKVVHGYVHHLRNVVGETVVSDRSGYRLEMGRATLDALVFEAALAETRTGDWGPAEVAERLAGALALWQGKPYADVDHSLALQPEITRLNELRLAALEARIEADLTLGGGSDLIGELRSLTAEYPLREHFAALLMRSLYGEGRQTEALRAFDRHRDYLIENVGLEPSPELGSLRDRIVAQDPYLTVSGRDSRSVHAIRGYELRGTMTEELDGRIDLAYQASVGRQVAIRVIEPPVANDTNFIADFAERAKAVSQLAHPHVVPVTDHWREAGRAFIVSPWYEGGTLKNRTLTASAVEQIALALAYSHRQGAPHGDISADNVFFDVDGNAYLGGFSARIELGDQAREGQEGLAPFQADIARFGILLAERSPQSWLDVEEIQDLISKAAVSREEDRFSRVEDLLRDFRRALGRDVTSMAGAPSFDRSDARNPFKGLRAFQEADSRDFFGRSDLSEHVIETLDRLRFVAVVGPSGSGKSSLIKAGVVPRLRQRAAANGSKLVVTDMYPGAYPFEELESALSRIATSPMDHVTETLTADDGGLLRVVKSFLPSDAQVVLVIDQFEELFAMVSDEAVRSLFIDSLFRLCEDTSTPVSVVITLRADYFNRPLEYGRFAEIVESGLVPVTPLSGEGIGRAISGPARAVGLDLEPGLVSRIVADVEGQPGGLPLLQYALTEMFEARDSNVLTIETYNRIGGVIGALAGRAETLHNELDSVGREVVRQCFLRLVTVDAERNDVRRRVRRSELTTLGVEGGVLEQVIQSYGASRLLSFDRDPQTRGPTVEVAHEALLREWDRLKTWIEHQRDDIVHHRALAAEVEQWRASERDPSYLLRGGRLAQFEAWAHGSTIRLTQLEDDFLKASIALRSTEEEKQARERRRLRWTLAAMTALAIVATVLGVAAFRSSEIAREQSEIAAQGEARAAESAEEARQAASRAEEAAQLALANEQRARAEALAAFSMASLASDPELSVLLGLTAIQADPSSASAFQALSNGYQANRTLLRFGDSSLTGGSMSPEGSHIVYSEEGELRLLDVTDPSEPVWVWPAPDEHFIVDAHFTRDGRSVVAGLGQDDGGCAWDRWVVFDASTGDVVADNRFPGLTSYFGGPAQNGPYLDIEQPMILSEGGAARCQANPRLGRVIAVELMSGVQRDLGSGVTAAGAFSGMPTTSRSGDRLALGVENRGGVVIDESLGEILTVPGGLSALNSDGSLVLAGNNPAELWDVDAGSKLREFKADFRMAWFSPSEDMVYGATRDGRIVVFDVETADLLFELRGHQGEIRTVQMTADESRIASFADDGARVWDIGSPLLSTARTVTYEATLGESKGIFQVPDLHVVGSRLVAKRGVCADSDCDVTGVRPNSLLFDVTSLYDVKTGTELASYPGGLIAIAPEGDLVALQQTGPPEDVTSLGVSDEADGEYIPYSQVVIADLDTGAMVTELEGLCLWYTKDPASRQKLETDDCSGYPEPWAEYAHYGAFSNDGTRLAIAGRTGRYAVWNTSTGELLWSHHPKEGEDLNLFALNTNIIYSPNDEYLLVAVGFRIEVRDAQSLDVVVAEFETEGGSPTAMEFTPEGNLLVMNDARLNVHVVSTEDWERVHTLTGQQGAFFPDIAVNPSGQLVATAGLDNESRVWDVQRGAELMRFVAAPISNGLTNVDWLDENTLVLGNRHTAVVLTLDPEVLAASARVSLTRSFTDAECLTYDLDPCPTLEDLAVSP